QPKGAAPAEQHRMDLVRRSHRAQQLRLPGSRSAAPDVEAGGRALRAGDDGAAGSRSGVLGLADLHIGAGSNLHLDHRETSCALRGDGLSMAPIILPQTPARNGKSALLPVREPLAANADVVLGTAAQS